MIKIITELELKLNFSEYVFKHLTWTSSWKRYYYSGCGNDFYLKLFKTHDLNGIYNLTSKDNWSFCVDEDIHIFNCIIENEYRVMFEVSKNRISFERDFHNYYLKTNSYRQALNLMML